MKDSDSDNVCDSSPSKSPVNSSVRKSRRVRSNVAFVKPDSDSEKDISPRKMRKLGRPELMAVPAKLIELLSINGKEAEVDNIEDYGDVIEAMLMQGVHSEIAADEEMVEASAECIYGDDEEEIDDKIEEMQFFEILNLTYLKS